MDLILGRMLSIQHRVSMIESVNFGICPHCKSLLFFGFCFLFAWGPPPWFVICKRCGGKIHYRRYKGWFLLNFISPEEHFRFYFESICLQCFAIFIKGWTVLRIATIQHDLTIFKFSIQNLIRSAATRVLFTVW